MKKLERKERKDFIEDLKNGVITKDGYTFSELATIYNYPVTPFDFEGKSAANLCKKDYYKYLKSLDKTKATKLVTSTSAVIDNDLSNLEVVKAWEVSTPDGVKVLKSYSKSVNTDEDIKNFRKELIEDVKKSAPKTINYKLIKKATGNQLILSIPDYHIGRETDVELVINTYLHAIETIVEDAVLYDIDEIVYVIGNDLFNSDTLDYKTTKGTQQFDYQDFRETFLLGKNIIYSSIELLKLYNLPIKVLFVEGNHDHTKVFMLSEVIQAMYTNDKQIEFVKGNRFHVHNYGNNLLMFDHGELKNDDYPMMLATEYPKEWGASKYRFIFNGHLHHTIYKDYRGNVKVMFLPSLTKPSDWEKAKGYQSIRQAQGHIINKESGLKNIIHYTID